VRVERVGVDQDLPDPLAPLPRGDALVAEHHTPAGLDDTRHLRKGAAALPEGIDPTEVVCGVKRVVPERQV
jgi:hypothetical protein